MLKYLRDETWGRRGGSGVFVPLEADEPSFACQVCASVPRFQPPCPGSQKMRLLACCPLQHPIPRQRARARLMSSCAPHAFRNTLHGLEMALREWKKGTCSFLLFFLICTFITFHTCAVSPYWACLPPLTDGSSAMELGPGLTIATFPATRRFWRCAFLNHTLSPARHPADMQITI